MQIKNVIFDLDGTLLDTTEGILESVKYTIEMLGLPDISDGELLTFIGPPIQHSFIVHYECSKLEAQKAADIFRNYYKEKAILKAKPYEGIYELCDQLRQRGIRMAVATYKREDYALKLLRHYDFDQYCNPMHGADSYNKLKKEDILDLCIREMGGNKDDSILIGDTVYDAIGAMNLGTAFLAVTYGFGFKKSEELENYSCVGIAKKPLDILNYIVESE